MSINLFRSLRSRIVRPAAVGFGAALAVGSLVIPAHVRAQEADTTEPPAESLLLREATASPGTPEDAGDVTAEEVSQARTAAAVRSVGTVTVDSIRTIEVWIRAFIPNTLSNTAVVPFGSYKGLTVTPGPNVPGLSPVRAFLDDQRTFSYGRSNSKGEGPSARLQSFARFTMRANGIRMTHRWGHVRGSIGVDNSDWTETCSIGNNVDSKELAGSLFSMPTYVVVNGTSLMVSTTVDAFGRNHCYDYASVLNPDIDYQGTLTVTASNQGGKGACPGGLISFDGAVDDFPSYEILVIINGSIRKHLLRFKPIGDVNGLYFDASNPVRRALRINVPNASGSCASN